uniref:Secreted protein n=1 Tax=Lactuca sativa TaxID=4236 RepID=A0A9R1WAQ3_LACSA|nr:hypothetical protein LSAT_V11C200084190 [Lactuca sativa]
MARLCLAHSTLARLCLAHSTLARLCLVHSTLLDYGYVGFVWHVWISWFAWHVVSGELTKLRAYGFQFWFQLKRKLSQEREKPYLQKVKINYLMKMKKIPILQ